MDKIGLDGINAMGIAEGVAGVGIQYRQGTKDNGGNDAVFSLDHMG